MGQEGQLRQERILAALVDYWERHRRGPTLTELAAMTGVPRGTVYTEVNRLIRADWAMAPFGVIRGLHPRPRALAWRQEHLARIPPFPVPKTKPRRRRRLVEAGREGGRTRMVRLSQEERSALGRHAARIRQSLPPERRGGRKSTGSCLKGHRYTDANTARSPKGTPVCRTCRLARQRSRIKGLDQRTALFRLEVARPFGQPESGSRILWYSPRPKEDQAVMLPGAAVMAIDPGTNRRYYGTIIAFHPQYNQYTMRTEIDGETETIWVPVNLVFPIED